MTGTTGAETGDGDGVAQVRILRAARATYVHYRTFVGNVADRTRLRLCARAPKSLMMPPYEISVLRDGETKPLEVARAIHANEVLPLVESLRAKHPAFDRISVTASDILLFTVDRKNDL